MCYFFSFYAPRWTVIVNFASCKNSINLSQLMRGGAEQFDGIGGGHEAAAGAKITKDKLDGFLDYLESNVTKMPNRDSNQ